MVLALGGGDEVHPGRECLAASTGEDGGAKAGIVAEILPGGLHFAGREAVDGVELGFAIDSDERDLATLFVKDGLEIHDYPPGWLQR